MDRQEFSTRSGTVLRRRKVQTLLMTIPATVLAGVGVLVLIPAVVWLQKLISQLPYNSGGLSDLLLPASEYLLIVSILAYFPLHIAMAFTGQWILEMISIFVGCVAVCSGGSSLYKYGLYIRILYQESSSNNSNYQYDTYYDELKHFNLGFAGCFLAMLALVASLTMIPLLKKFRDQSSGASYSYAPLPQPNIGEHPATLSPTPPGAVITHLPPGGSSLPTYTPGPTYFPGNYPSSSGKFPAAPSGTLPQSRPAAANPPYWAATPAPTQPPSQPPQQELRDFPSAPSSAPAGTN